MANSSCNCYKCTQQRYMDIQPGAVPTNLFIPNCEKPSGFNCGNALVFRQDIQPRHQVGYHTLNPQVVQEKFTPGFYKAPCNKEVYLSNDPRLISVAHGGAVLHLDRPPLDSNIQLSELNTEPALNNYGRGYMTYADINAGDIEYYIDKSVRDPFYQPVFNTPAHVTSVLFRDPMGVYKPHYERIPMSYKNPVTDPKNHFDGSLSFIDDSQAYRQDLMARQMAIRNQQRWQSHWQ